MSDRAPKDHRNSSVEADPIAFLVRFATADLGQFRKGDWLNLQDDLAAFCWRVPLSGPLSLTLMEIRKPVRPNSLDSLLIRELQHSVWRLLRTVAEAQSATNLLGLTSAIFERANIAFAIDASQGRPLALCGASQDLLFVKAALLLA